MPGQAQNDIVRLPEFIPQVSSIRRFPPQTGRLKYGNNPPAGQPWSVSKDFPVCPLNHYLNPWFMTAHRKANIGKDAFMADPCICFEINIMHFASALNQWIQVLSAIIGWKFCRLFTVVTLGG